ncbi:MAG: helix-turn-helix transcriptional regulator [Ruminococcaceae bacterium]|nr:helix-turn-helix transcriptional regulator [Oscillospiraceae bacterium]
MELMETTDLNKFIKKNQDKFYSDNIAELLNELYIKRDISKAALAKKSCISEVYLHQVFAGQRNPSRNRLLCICFGLEASMDETQNLLKHCGYGQLYSRKKRDAVIIYGLLHNMSLPEVNEKLASEGEELLY